MSKKRPLGRVDAYLLPLLRDEFKGPFDDVFNQVFNSFFNDYNCVQSFTTKRAYPKVDVFRIDKDLVFEAAVPGMTRDQLSVEVEDGVLTIQGESQLKIEPTQEEGEYVLGMSILKELKKSSFIRRFTLPPELHIDNLDATEAKLENGILEVRFVGVYDKEEPEPKAHTIDIK